MTKPVPWTRLHPDAQTDAIAWHRDHRDVSGEQKLDLIAAIDSAAYDRAHAALDAILGPLLVPYEIGGPAGRAAQDELLRMWIELGEAVGRFIAARRAPHPFFAGAQQYGLGLSGMANNRLIAEQQSALSSMQKAQADVVEMTEAEYRASWEPANLPPGRMDDYIAAYRLGLGKLVEYRGNRRVRIVERQDAGRGEESDGVEWLTQEEWAWRRKEIGAGLICYASPPEYDAFGDTLRPGHSIRVVPDGTKWGIWWQPGSGLGAWCNNTRDVLTFPTRQAAEARRTDTWRDYDDHRYSVRPLLSSSDKGRRG